MRDQQQEAVATLEASGEETLSFVVTDVTGTYTVQAEEVQSSLEAGTVARSLASQMSLPESPWALRDDSKAAFLKDDRPIGEQIEPGARVTLTTKTHLGAC